MERKANDFREWLTDELKRMDMSQNELGRRAGVSSGTMSEIISGLRNPTWNFCAAIDVRLMVDRMRAALRFAGDEATPENQKLMVNSIFARLEVAKNVIAHYQPLPWARLLFG